MDAQYCDLTKQGLQTLALASCVCPYFHEIDVFTFGRTSFERYTLAVHRGESPRKLIRMRMNKTTSMPFFGTVPSQQYAR